MALPRFTSGRVGNLEFSHLNEAFDRIESNRGGEKAMSRRAEYEWLYVVLLSESAPVPDQISNRWSWKEIDRDPTTGGFSERVGGRSSFGADNDPFALPAISISGTQSYSTGDLVLIRIMRFPNGKPFALIVKPTGSDVAMFEITNSTGIGLGRWRYTAHLRSFGSEWFVSASDTDYTLHNGCENTVDTGNTIGVGTVKPNSASAIRQPVRNGTIVMATFSASGWVFSIPNGYSFSCA
jgi:hypothetical protein